jgi:hypothetical protein
VYLGTLTKNISTHGATQSRWAIKKEYIKKRKKRKKNQEKERRNPKIKTQKTKNGEKKQKNIKKNIQPRQADKILSGKVRCQEACWRQERNIQQA